MRYVIAVAAPVGGGKTSFVKALADRLKDATAIYFDHYEKATGKPVHHLVQWMQNGADFNDFIVPDLSRDLGQLKQGKSVVDPLTKKEIPSKKFIVFEMPLGKEHKDTAKHIDRLIWIDVPLDIALARKIKEFTGDFLTTHKPETHKDCMIWLHNYLANYLNVVRDVLRIQEERVRASADIVIDGRTDFETMIQRATEEIFKFAAKSVDY